MPGLDGLEVCRCLKAHPKTAPIPVVFLMEVEDDAVRGLAYAAGAVACLSKRFPLDALVTVVQATIANAERQAKRKAKQRGDGG
jgi:putative two-component system response regulator